MMELEDVKDLLEQIPDQPGYETDGFLMDLESALVSLEAKLETMEQALFEAGEVLGTHVGLTTKTSVAISAIRIKRRMTIAQQEQEDE